VGLVVWLAHRVVRETEQTQAEYHRALAAEEALAERLRLQAGLLEWSREIAHQRDLDRQLEAVLRAAHQLTQARYGALGVFEKSGLTFARFLTVGLDEATKAAIGAPPTGRGLLRELAHDPGVLRLKDLTQHPAFSGFPPHHPAMRSFLGISLRARGTLYGRLYLTDKEPEFTELDEQLIQLLAAQASIAIENTLVIQDLQRTTNELQRTNATLRQVSHELEEMTSIIAHDLKAPLVTIQGYAGRLKVTAGQHLDEKGRHALEVILEVSKVMGQMVEALLEFSRLHRRPLRPQPCDLAQAVARVWESLEESVLATGAQLSLACAPSAAYVWIDPLVLYEVLENLLGNALKFRAADRSPAIEVGGRLEAGQVLLWVKDNGRGLPAEKCEEVFQIFRKLDRETPGVGVGLGQSGSWSGSVGGGCGWNPPWGKGPPSMCICLLPQRPLPARNKPRSCRALATGCRPLPTAPETGETVVMAVTLRKGQLPTSGKNPKATRTSGLARAWHMSCWAFEQADGMFAGEPKSES
jgi:signal transduction histidine kinase